MSLPAGQARALRGIEGALQASEPGLASMFALFTRLGAGEPVGAEGLPRPRPRWPRPGTAVPAVLLIPVMFAAVLVGAMLGGSARGAASCQVARPGGGTAALMHRPVCAATPATPAATCAGAGPAIRFTTLTAGRPASSPPGRVRSGTARSAAMC
jgi:hypothetical protein